MKIAVIILSGLFLVSCSTTTKRSQKSGALNVSVSSSLHADLEVDMSKKISGSARYVRLFGIFDMKSSEDFVDGITYGGSQGFSLFTDGLIEEAKSAAAYDAIVPNQVDVLVAPQYIIKVETFLGVWKKVTALVTGYAGRVKDIKQIKPITVDPVATK